MIKKVFGILVLVLFLFKSDLSAQMTTWQMDNFKKNDKNRQKRMKTKGPILNTKQSKQKKAKSLKNRSKSPFLKKRYDVGYLPNEPLDYLTVQCKEKQFTRS